MEAIVAKGTVKWFNSTKGYGFIQPVAGGRDVFVHISAVERAGLSTSISGTANCDTPTQRTNRVQHGVGAERLGIISGDESETICAVECAYPPTIRKKIRLKFAPNSDARALAGRLPRSSLVHAGRTRHSPSSCGCRAPASPTKCGSSTRGVCLASDRRTTAAGNGEQRA